VTKKVKLMRERKRERERIIKRRKEPNNGEREEKK